VKDGCWNCTFRVEQNCTHRPERLGFYEDILQNEKGKIGETERVIGCLCDDLVARRKLANRKNRIGGY
jgi:hypothetical protein